MTDGNGGANYAVTYVTANTGRLIHALLTVTAQAPDPGLRRHAWARAWTPVVTGTLYDAVGTAATQTFDTKHVGTGKTLTPAAW